MARLVDTNQTEALLEEIGTNVALTSLLPLCDRSMVIWCHSALYFARYPQPKTYLQRREKVGNAHQSIGQANREIKP